jgi:hypothetical protein
VGREGLSHSLQWGNAIGEQYTGNPYVRFDEGTEVVRPPPTLLGWDSPALACIHLQDMFIIKNKEMIILCKNK